MKTIVVVAGSLEVGGFILALVGVFGVINLWFSALGLAMLLIGTAVADYPSWSRKFEVEEQH